MNSLKVIARVDDLLMPEGHLKITAISNYSRLAACLLTTCPVI